MYCNTVPAAIKIAGCFHERGGLRVARFTDSLDGFARMPCWCPADDLRDPIAVEPLTELSAHKLPPRPMYRVDWAV